MRLRPILNIQLSQASSSSTTNISPIRIHPHLRRSSRCCLSHPMDRLSTRMLRPRCRISLTHKKMRISSNRCTRGQLLCTTIASIHSRMTEAPLSSFSGKLSSISPKTIWPEIVGCAKTSVFPPDPLQRNTLY
jgi:hypothetical protein